jgi:hypothetical protein
VKVNAQEPPEVEPEPEPVVGCPFKEAWTFAIVVESAPKDCSNDTIASTWL